MVEPHSLQTLAGRLRQVADLYPSRDVAAAAAGVSRPQLSRYLNGTTKIPLLVTSRLAEPHQVSLDWIASGRGTMFADGPGSRDAAAQARMMRVTQDMDRLLRRDGLSLPAARRRSLAKAIVDMAEKDGGTTSDIDVERYTEVIRLVARG